MRLLESKSRPPQAGKDSATRKTYDEVFDHAAAADDRLAHHGRRHLYLGLSVSTGKEANVFHATTPQGRAAP